jgi:hypothetical protein
MSAPAAIVGSIPILLDNWQWTCQDCRTEWFVA